MEIAFRLFITQFSKHPVSAGTKANALKVLNLG
jgi:hypothetical protein